MEARDIGVVLVGGMRSHQENYAAAFAAQGCRLLAVGLAEGVSSAEAGRHAELAAALDLPLLPLGDALHLPGANVASIAVSVPHRARVAAACARAGLHLYLDKPLAGSAADAAAIASLVAEAGVEAQVFSQVTAGWAQRAREAIRSGRLGRIASIHADMLMAKGVPAPIPAAPRRETAAPTDFPDDIAKRELTDMGIYPVSLVAWLLGTRALAVTATSANHFFAEHLSRDVEDYGAMLLEFEGGITASITCGRTGWASWHQPFLACVVIVGEDDTLILGNSREQLTLTTSRGAAPPQSDPIDPMNMWLSTAKRAFPAAIHRISLESATPPDVAFFVRTLAGSPEKGIGTAQAAHHCEILAAAYRSAAEQRKVLIDQVFQTTAGSR